MKKVVVFGAGLVSGPLVHYLLECEFDVTVATRTVSKAQKLIQGYAHGHAQTLDVNNEVDIRKLVNNADIAISILPAPYHPQIARQCVDLGKHMVTTSYTSPQMRALDSIAKQKNLVLLNETGVDPGLDHMSAMKVIHAQENAGGNLVGFSSWCGGLPAPEASDNPFNYKFSWAPRGVLVAARNSARYLRDGKVVQVASDELFANPSIVDIPGVGKFEGYPNRDSLAYLDMYNFDKNTVKNMFRGTLRNIGHCRLYRCLVQLGLLDLEHEYDLDGLTYRSLMEKKYGIPLSATIARNLGEKDAKSVLQALAYIGMLSDDPIETNKASLLDLMSVRMAKYLAYKNGERDMLLMRHDLTFQYKKKSQHERITAIMVDYGIPYKDTSMARTVGLPAAIGARMILEGKIDKYGVQIPIYPQIYEPILKELKTFGISFTETRVQL